MFRSLSLVGALSGLIAFSTACQAAPEPISSFEANDAIYWPSTRSASASRLNLNLPTQQISGNIYALDGDSSELSAVTPDKAGLIRDTKYFFAYQVVIVGLLYAAPQSFSGWTDEQKEDFSFEKYKNNVRHAVWDSDQWDINYILHPYWGSAYYVRARERGYDPNTAFWYSVALSTSFEYGFEALFEEPSLQDIIITPVAGSFLGIYFMKIRKDIRERRASGAPKRWYDSWLMGLTDPLGTMNKVTDRWFYDEKASASLSPVIALPAYRHTELDNRYHLTQEPALGMQYSYRW